MEKLFAGIRRILAAVFAILSALIPALQAIGIPIPDGLSGGISDLFQAITALLAALLALWSKFRPEPPVGTAP